MNDKLWDAIESYRRSGGALEHRARKIALMTAWDRVTCRAAEAHAALVVFAGLESVKDGLRMFNEVMALDADGYENRRNTGEIVVVEAHEDAELDDIKMILTDMAQAYVDCLAQV